MVLTQEMIEEAAALFQAHILGPPTIFNREGEQLLYYITILVMGPPPSVIGKVSNYYITLLVMGSLTIFNREGE